MIKKAIFILFSILLNGCVHIPMDKQEQQSIKSVYINPTIKKPDKAYEFRNGDEFGLIAIAARHAIDSANGQNESMKTLADKNHIDISQIVYQAWKNQLSNSQYQTSNGPSDVTLSTEIKQYGISTPPYFSNSYVPVLVIESKLIKHNKVIWQDRESVNVFADKLPKYQMYEIFLEPNNLKIMWSKAADLAVTKMMADIRK